MISAAAAAAENSAENWPLAIGGLIVVVIGAGIYGAIKRKRELANPTPPTSASYSAPWLGQPATLSYAGFTPTWPSAERQAELSEHHRPHWQSDRARFIARPEHLGLAIAAPYALCQGGNWDSLRNRDPQAAASILSGAWGVTNRRALLQQLHSLLVNGHRSRFDDERAYWMEMDPNQAAEVEADLREMAGRSEESVEELWRFRRIRANDRGVQSVDFAAWDFVRFAMLVRLGVTAGFLSEAEGEDFLLLIAAETKNRFRSWEELGAAFNLGRWYWNSQGGDGERETDEHDANRYGVLMGDAGPWRHVPYTMSIPPHQGLFVDALMEQGLIHPYTPEYVPHLSDIEQRLDADVRARL